MKRFAIPLLIVAGLAILAGLVLPRLVSTDLVRQALAHQIAGWTGRSLTFEGDPVITFDPYLSVRLNKVSIGRPDNGKGEPLVTMDSLTAELRIASLLLGRAEANAFTLERPSFRFVVGPDGAQNWSLPTGPESGTSFGRFTIRDGSIAYVDPKRPAIAVSGVNATLSWPDLQDTASVSGKLVWQGEPIEFNGSVGAPAELLAGRPSALRFAIASTPLRASFTGTASNLDGFESQGEVSLTTPSLRRIIGWLGQPLEEGSTLGAASLQAQARWLERSALFTAARLEIDGNAGDGALTLDFSGARPGVQGTLAFETLDLSSYAQAFESAVAKAHAVPSMPLSLPPLDRFDVDLRLSANQVLLGSARLGRTAATVAVRDSRLGITIGEAQIYGGRLMGSVTAASVNGEVVSSMQARLDTVPMRVALSDLFGVDPIDGTGAGTIGLSGRGATYGAFIGSLSGQGSFSVANGRLRGIDVAAIAGKAQASDGASSSGAAFLSGSTPFAMLDSAFSIADGKASTQSSTISGTGYRITLEGTAPLGEPTLSARGELSIERTKPTDTLALKPVVIPFAIGGSWAHPTIVPDFTGLFRRSAYQPPHGNLPLTR